MASTDTELPAKEYFRIGEVARLVGVKPYVLRYWESEFKRDIRPERTPSNQRMYRRRDVETFIEIKRLRYEEQLELPGARRQLRKNSKDAKAGKMLLHRVRSGDPVEANDVDQTTQAAHPDESSGRDGHEGDDGHQQTDGPNRIKRPDQIDPMAPGNPVDLVDLAARKGAALADSDGVPTEAPGGSGDDAAHTRAEQYTGKTIRLSSLVPLVYGPELERLREIVREGMDELMRIVDEDEKHA